MACMVRGSVGGPWPVVGGGGLAPSRLPALDVGRSRCRGSCSRMRSGKTDGKVRRCASFLGWAASVKCYEKIRSRHEDSCDTL